MQTIQQRLNAIPEGHWLLIVGTRIEHAITGTVKIGVMKNGLVKVEYEDGLIEERQGNGSLLETMDADNPSLFRLVEYVQDGREPK